MSLSAAASRLAPNPRAEALSERGHALQQRRADGSRRRRRTSARRSSASRRPSGSLLGGTRCTACPWSGLLSKARLPLAIDAFRMAARAAPDWFAPKQALEMLGASLDEGKSSAAPHDDDDDVDMPPARK